MSDEIKLWRIGTPGFGSNPFAKDWAIGEGQTLEDAVAFAIEDSGLEEDVADYVSDGGAPLIFGGYVVETHDHSDDLDIKAMGGERVLVWSSDGYTFETKLVPRGPKFMPGQWIRHTATGTVFRVETFEWWNDEKGYLYRGVTSPHEGNGTQWEQGDEGDVELTNDPTPPHKKPPVEVCRVEEDGSSAILMKHEGDGGYTLAYEPIAFGRGAYGDIGELIETERRRLRERIELLGKLKVKAGAAGQEEAMAAMFFGGDQKIADEQERIIKTGALPWACDVCGGNGLKSRGPEGYCLDHAPEHWDMEFAKRAHADVWGAGSDDA